MLNGAVTDFVTLVILRRPITILSQVMIATLLLWVAAPTAKAEVSVAIVLSCTVQDP